MSGLGAAVFGNKYLPKSHILRIKSNSSSSRIETANVLICHQLLAEILDVFVF